MSAGRRPRASEGRWEASQDGNLPDDLFGIALKTNILAWCLSEHDTSPDEPVSCIINRENISHGFIFELALGSGRVKPFFY